MPIFGLQMSVVYVLCCKHAEVLKFKFGGLLVFSDFNNTRQTDKIVTRSSLGLLCMQIVVMEAEMVLHVHKEKYQNHDNFVLFIYCVLFFFFLLQPPLLKAIFNVDPDEVRSLIFKKEDVNAQVSPTVTNICICFLILLLFLGGA